MRPFLTVDDRYSDALVSVLNGATRSTILVGPWALKLPSYRGWRPFLRGLLANAQEREWWDGTRDPRLCPVRFAVPGGWFLLMPRCEPVENLTATRFASFTAASPCCAHDDDAHAPGGGCAACDPRGSWDHDYDPGIIVPAEFKPDSFGWLGGAGREGYGRLVAVDYGN